MARTLVNQDADGILVLAETSISYLDDINGEFLSDDLEEPTQIVAWTQIDSQRWLLAEIIPLHAFA